MSASPKRVVAEESDLGTWPHDVSHQGTLKIGEVIGLLAYDFPFLAASKIRYFESQELITPQRTASNQRLFSMADVERLRFILVEQRDRYVALPQIKEMLRQLDAGESTAHHPGLMRVVSDRDRAKPSPGTRLHIRELADLVGASCDDIQRYIDARILTTDARGRLTSQAVDIVRFGLMLEAKGMDIRHVRAIRHSAHSHAANIVTMLATERTKNTPLAKERVIAETSEFATIFNHLYQALLLENIDVELR
ncbi:MerR family transcriptional regulator [Arcanobacterium haemolyticum]|uniref:Transcriptional regulator, MerR family n=1 Tax=Arcanobacterium haemolyticum (strain ATCC 9345 / DSM 20595 / CCM 5947 / CCUG 17215 / LMG 16163 / NBRC 15585 / NCTC 8452 / 11018) TaxID=644284 RepID=D7BNU7_ARCHD|nr:MerR family transcriptional regulator [Arcanobacterium haemolyticum]ADH92596.1 transcriptional regulator, MerR family [Arcanobacterium haemolyticum DSM 20595]QCX46713.1 MerR family transcriptional regulator [Arcanobacterium haemolyticum]SPT74426.1 HTH-type transcriptional regulator glnR [Arcanobacterium haemolyticum]SQH28670.1 HTH-type transcriptional regulator glnR [Arcanobacterium haemolyticum]